jgi:hypothetical protein
MKATVTGTGTNAITGTILSKAKTSSDMTTGFGSGIFFSVEDNGVAETQIGSIAVTRGAIDTHGTMVFRCHSTSVEGMRLQGSVDDPTNEIFLGVGTTAPKARLEVSYNGADSAKVARFTSTYTSGATSGAGMIGYSNDGAALASGDRLGFFLLGGAKDNANSLVQSAGMIGYTTENWDASGVGSELRFATTPNNSLTRTDRMVITQDGVVRVLDKIAFTQTDHNEYIDSLADGYLDIGATTAIRLKADTTLDANMDLNLSGTGFVDSPKYKAGGTDPVADGTYAFYNDGTTSGQVTSITTKGGIITAVAVIP